MAENELQQRCLYASYYCEENIWHLCQSEFVTGTEKKVVFVSNERRCCAFWNQKLSETGISPVFWDYHVVLLSYFNEKWSIWDLDTMLDFPCECQVYLEKTFPGIFQKPEYFAPLFRVFDSDFYVEEFSSDRSHMLDENGQRAHPEPPWSHIFQPSKKSFFRWTEMNRHDEDVLTLDELTLSFGGSR